MDNLSYCAAKAKEAKISYGNYMAINFVPTIHITIKFDSDLKECIYCKELFYPNSKRVKYCSGVCAANANRYFSNLRYKRIKEQKQNGQSF